jgi:hypothetical protein
MTGPPPSTTLGPIARISAHGPWVIVSVALRYARTYPWDAWAEVRQHIPRLLAEQGRIRKAGRFN